MPQAPIADPHDPAILWQPKRIRLKYTFAGRLWAEAEFNAYTWNPPVDFQASSGDLMPSPLEYLPPCASAARITSYPVESPAPRLRLLPRAIRYAPDTYRHHYVDLGMGFEAYRKHFGPKSRHTIGYSVRKFANVSGGEIDWREYRTPESVDAFYQSALQVSRKTYQGRLLGAGIREDAEFRSGLHESATRGEMRGYVLFLDGTPVAYSLHRSLGRSLVLDKTGYDTDNAVLSPGTVLLWLILQKAFEEQAFNFFDFGQGDFGYKEHFGTGFRLGCNLYYFRRTWRNMVLVTSHLALDSITAVLKRGLRLISIEGRLRKAIQRR